jgi:hypothetical protein
VSCIVEVERDAATHASLSHPIDFRCLIKPRSPLAKELIAEGVNFRL